MSQSVTTSTVSLKEVHYLGLKPVDPDAGDILNSQVYDSIAKIAEKYPCESLDHMKSALEVDGLEQLGWTIPSMPYHITSHLINGKATVKNRKAIEEFKIGIEEQIPIKCIIIVENLFIATLCNPKLIDVSAKIPYMALWMNGAKPKDCTKILEYLLYQVKPSIKHGEEKLRTYYSIQNKAILKDDVVGEIDIHFDVYKSRRVWYCFIKDNVKLGFESFVKKIGDEE